MSGHSRTMKSRSSGRPDDRSTVMTSSGPSDPRHGRAPHWTRGRVERCARLTLQPFRIHIPDERLALLDERLRTTVWGDEPADVAAWEYGVPTRYLREL